MNNPKSPWRNFRVKEYVPDAPAEEAYPHADLIDARTWAKETQVRMPSRDETIDSYSDCSHEYS